jgi:hypothetical protein
MMNEGNTVLSQPWRDFYNRLAWVMLDLNQPQFLLAFRLWLQQQNKKKSGQTRATALLKRMK